MNDLRITSGIYKGRSIKSPHSKLTHPMGSREKLALFNMIASYLPSARVLDAFAGSGALGIEALSRGASEVVFVEKSPQACQVIRENLTSLGLESEVFQGDISKYQSGKQFDVIITDPPYDDFHIEKVLYLTNLLKDGGVMALSHPGATPVIDGLELTKSRKYAGATISIYQK